MVAVSVDIDTSGPMFDARIYRAINNLIEDAQHAVGQAALSEWHMNLDGSIRNPTPYYETQLIAERVGHDVVVHDRGIIYGPWLEGTSSRNQTTRFKGYAAARRSTQAVQERVPSIVARILPSHLARMQ